jgi:hypothetical protein
MGILDWFKNRPGQFDPDRVSDEMVRWAVDKAITLTNPRLKLLPNCHKRLTPAVETTIEFPARAGPGAARPCERFRRRSGLPIRPCGPFSSHRRISRPSSAARTICAPCSTSSRNSTRRYLVLGMALNEQRVFGMALHGNMVQRDVAQTSVSFSDHRARLCGRDESRLRRVVGVEVFEYLVAHALVGDRRGACRKAGTAGKSFADPGAPAPASATRTGPRDRCSASSGGAQRAGQTGGGTAGKRAATGSDRRAVSRRWKRNSNA